MKKKDQFKTYFLLIISLLVFQGLRAQTNQEYKLGINDIQLKLEKNWMNVPQSANCKVRWEAFIVNEDNYEPLSIAEFDSFKVMLSSQDVVIQSKNVANASEVLFGDLKIGNEYSIQVIGYSREIPRVESRSANLFVGKESVLAAQGPSSFRIQKYNPLRFLSGRIPMAAFRRGEVFDAATKAGKVAFHFIWWFFLIGSIIVVLYCVPRLRLSKIFPVKKSLTYAFSLDKMYIKRKNYDFEKILVEWKETIEEANEYVSNKIKEKDLKCMSDIQAENIEFWKTIGYQKIGKLKERLDELESVQIGRKHKESQNEQIIKMQEHLPTLQIIRAGLENHELGGYRWLEVSQEVDRAIENRAASELETLRRKSYIDWLWNLGTLAPLVGLFGTASGISHAFAMLSITMGRGADVTQSTIVRRLSGGIFEALWTTIEGLFVGILFMLIYYYYHNKLNWIYAKWEELYVWISEKL